MHHGMHDDAIGFGGEENRVREAAHEHSTATAMRFGKGEWPVLKVFERRIDLINKFIA
jgi:hypothetical protein